MNVELKEKRNWMETGTVIDHIPTGNIQEIIKILRTSFDAKNVEILYKVLSYKYKNKDIMFLPNIFLSTEKISKIKQFNSQITISYIKNKKVFKKE